MHSFSLQPLRSLELHCVEKTGLQMISSSTFHICEVRSVVPAAPHCTGETQPESSPHFLLLAPVWSYSLLPCPQYQYDK